MPLNTSNMEIMWNKWKFGEWLLTGQKRSCSLRKPNPLQQILIPWIIIVNV